MKRINLTSVSSGDYKKLLKRPFQDDGIYNLVAETIKKISNSPEDEILGLIKKFDNVQFNSIDELKVTDEEFEKALSYLSEQEKNAIDIAYENIYKFHYEQLPKSYKIENGTGSYCSRKYVPINDVGLYIPGGTAVLPSTVLMLGIPAKIAGCKRVISTTPVKNDKKISPYVLYAAQKCGIKEIYKLGGIQAIYLMAYGLKNIKKVDKIFGPGNRYVTAAKVFVSSDINANCSIDMPAGPSEVLVIADNLANPKFIAADLLSQAEHGIDSQVILVSPYEEIFTQVENEISAQTNQLDRNEIIEKSLQNSLMIKTDNIEQALEFSNDYAPEHLILHLKDFDKYIDKITNAGSVFLGDYSPESFGDYASGTNHSLPTNGYAKSFSGIGVEAFMKSITFQYHTYDGFIKLAETVETLANIENLKAHKNAVTIRKRGQ